MSISVEAAVSIANDGRRLVGWDGGLAWIGGGKLDSDGAGPIPYKNKNEH